MTYIVKHRQKELAAAAAAATLEETEDNRPLRIECEDINARYKLIQIEGSGLYILAKDGEPKGIIDNDAEKGPEHNDIRVTEKGRVLRAMKAVMVENPGAVVDEPECYPHPQLLWHDIAEIIDRFFFWLCFFTMITSTLSMLVIMPLSKPDPLTLDSWGSDRSGPTLTTFP